MFDMQRALFVDGEPSLFAHKIRLNHITSLCLSFPSFKMEVITTAPILTGLNEVIKASENSTWNI